MTEDQSRVTAEEFGSEVIAEMDREFHESTDRVIAVVGAAGRDDGSTVSSCIYRIERRGRTAVTSRRASRFSRGSVSARVLLGLDHARSTR